MEDYVEEINTALANRGEDSYFESLDEVITNLKNESEQYHDKAKQRATSGLGFSAAGITGKLVPEFYSQAAEQMDSLTQSDLATVGLAGALGISTVPAYLTKRNLDERDEINQMVQDLEEGNFDGADTDFAYEIAERLS